MQRSNALRADVLAIEDEEVHTGAKVYEYARHRKYDSLQTQVALLAHQFPEIDPRPVYDYIRTGLADALHGNAESRFPVLRRQPELYPDQLKRMISILKTCGIIRRGFGEEHYDYVRTQERTLDYLDMVGREQPGDILILDAQFGRLHAGKCARDLDHGLTHPEFQLGGLEGASMLLTNRWRMSSMQDPFFFCGGDRYNSGSGPDSRLTVGFGVEKSAQGMSSNAQFITPYVEDADPANRWGGITAFVA